MKGSNQTCKKRQNFILLISVIYFSLIMKILELCLNLPFLICIIITSLIYIVTCLLIKSLVKYIKARHK